MLGVPYVKRQCVRGGIDQVLRCSRRCRKNLRQKDPVLLYAADSVGDVCQAHLRMRQRAAGCALRGPSWRLLRHAGWSSESIEKLESFAAELLRFGDEGAMTNCRMMCCRMPSRC